MTHTTAKIIADTVNPFNKAARITTFEVYAPRFLLAEVNTHGVLAKSAASSRAIPVKKRIEMVRDHGFVPKAFGKNKAGMQAAETLTDGEAARAEMLWRGATLDAVKWAESLEGTGVHKQHANRILEPFAYYHGVITATEWENFFKLRLHPDAQPEFQELAALMNEAMNASTPVKQAYHLPYVDLKDVTPDTLDRCFKISAARCARVSYKTFDGKLSTFEEDEALCKKLVESGHMSPFDHPASADAVVKEDGPFYSWRSPEMHRRFWGWVSERAIMEDNAGIKSRRDPNDVFEIDEAR